MSSVPVCGLCSPDIQMRLLDEELWFGYDEEDRDGQQSIASWNSGQRQGSEGSSQVFVPYSKSLCKWGQEVILRHEILETNAAACQHMGFAMLLLLAPVLSQTCIQPQCFFIPGSTQMPSRMRLSLWCHSCRRRRLSSHLLLLGSV